MNRLIAVLCPSLLLAFCCLAQTPAPPAASQPGATMPATRIAPPQAEEVQSGPLSVTRHTLKLPDGKTIDYTATAGYLRIRDAAGKDKADIFFTAYTRDGQDAAVRPVTFSFNGGPGAASQWLHLGAMGPRRVVMPQEGTVVPKTFEIVDNEYTWLDFTDLVFIDPVGSGYSVAATGVDPKEFFTVDGDVESVGEFIRLYVSRNSRWLSPKYLAGESYGTTRAAGLASRLQDRHGMNLSGLVMVSSALNFQAILFHPGNDLAYALAVPSYTAVAWYHKRLDAELQKDLAAAVAKAERWSVDQLLPALTRGDALDANTRKELVAAYSRFTGLPAEYVDRANLRVPNHVFAKQLLAEQKKMIGVLDARIAGAAPDPVLSFLEYDESLFVVIGPYAAAIQDYLRRELRYASDLRYEFLSNATHAAWNWGSGQGYLNTTDSLRGAMLKNTNLRVLAAIAYFDLATGYFGQEYSYSHLGLPAELRGNVKTIRYEAGHQIYTHMPSLKKLTSDVRQFYSGQ